MTVTPSVSGNTEVTVSGALTFTASTWDQAQTVTVSAAQDADAATDTATIGHAVSGGDYGVNSVTADDIAVTVDDDETVSTQVTLTVDPAALDEDDSATIVTVTGTLNGGARNAATVVTVSVGASNDAAVEGTDYATVNGFTLTIDTGQTAGTASFTLIPSDDDVDEANETLTVAGSTTATGLAVNPTTVSIADDDERGVEVGVTALTVSEGGDATYTVVLESEPTGDVTVAPSVSGNTEVTVSGALTFTASTWDQAQTVTVSAQDDADAVTDTATIGHAVSGGDYGANSVAAGDIAVTVDDDETVSTEVTLTVDPAALDEDDSATIVTVTGTLNGGARNAATVVTVSVGASNDAAVEGTDYATVNGFTLTIDTGQTAGTASFTLIPSDDDVDEANETLTVAGSTTATGLAVNPTTVSIADDDERGVEVGVTALTVSEGGDATYTVVLTSQPTGDVTVTPSVSGNTEVTVSGTLTFTASTWDQAQTVTVSAAQDADAATDTATIGHAVAGGDYGVNSVTADDIAVTVDDDETVSTQVTLTVDPAALDEDDSATIVTVTGTLNGGARNAATVVTVSVGASNDAAVEGTDYATVNGFTLTIDTGQTAGTASFTLIPSDDDVDEASEALTVAGSTTATGLAINATTVSIADDDERGVEVGITALAVPEGGDATYTVVLESEPTGNVTVTPSVSGNTEVTVSGTLTFTAGTWDQAQTVTVSAAQDADAATDTATIGHAVSGGDYGVNSVTADDIAVTVDDDETVSTEVTLTVDPAALDEDDSATIVTVTGTLNGGARNAATVVTVSVGASNDAAVEGTDYATVNGFTLTIDTGQTAGTASFMLIPTDDDVDEANEALTVAGSTTATGFTVNPTAVTIADDDERGVEVGVTALTVSEGGDATYTVVLESEPTGNVTVAPSVSGSTEVTVSGTLTFTAGTWDQAQTVTVSAQDDADAATDTATIGHAVSGGDYGANSVTADDIAVTVNDDETVSTQVTLTVNPASVSEDAGATEVTVTGTLNGGARNAATVVTVSVGDAGDAATEGTDYGTLGSVTLTIAAGSTSGTQTFTLTPTDDDVDEAGEALTVAGSTTATGFSVNPTTVTIADDDERGVEVGVTALTVSEGGDATYTVVLTSQPTGNVTVTPSVSGSTEVTVSGALTFAASTWNQAQTVTVSAQDDADAATDTATIGHAVSGGDYGVNSVTADDIAVTVDDDETVSTQVTLTVNPASVSEDAGATEVTVTGTLNEGARAAPTVVTVSVGDAGDVATEGTDYGTLGSVTLTIAAGSTSGTTTFTLTPTDDDVDEASEALTVAGSTTATGLAINATTVSIADDDERGVDVGVTALTVPEGGDATYTVVLESEPTGGVTVAPSVSGNTEVTVSGTLTFTAGTWDQAQTVTVSAAQDADAVTDTATIGHAVSGGDYGVNSVTADDIAVTVNDDETVSTQVTLTVNPASVSEDAGATEVTVTGTLNGGARNAATVVTVSVGDAGDAATEGTDYGTLGSVTLTIAAGSTSGTQTFTLTPTDDDVDEASEALTVAGSTTATGLAINATTVSIADDDERGVEVGVTALTVSEGGDATYTVVLESEPTGNVTVTPSVSGNTEVTVSGTLTFTAGTWDQAQTVTVSAVQDADAVTDTATIGHAVSGGDYGANSVAAGDIAVTVNDDETVSTQVTLTVNPASVSEDAGATEVTVTGTLNGGARNAATVVTVSVGDAGDVATEGTDYGTLGSVTLTIAAGSTSGTQTFTLTPTDDDVDEASEALTVAGSTTATGFTVNGTTVTIADDDERGVAVSVTTLTVPEGGDATYTVVLESEPTGDVTVTPSVTPPVDGSTDVTVSGTLTFTASDWNQAQTVTVSAQDDADIEEDVVVDLAHAVSGGDYSVNDVTAASVTVTVPGFEEDAGGTVALKVPATGDPVVTVPEGASVPAGTQVTLPPGTDTVAIRMVADSDPVLAEPPQGFRAGDVVVDIEPDPPLSPGQTAVVCLPASGADQRVHRWDDGADPPEWVELEPPPGGSPPGLVCGVTDHFSPFALGSALRNEHPASAEHGELRLVDDNGPTAAEGRLEVFHTGEWGTVCDDQFDEEVDDPRTPFDRQRVPNRAPQKACEFMGYATGEMIPQGSISLAPESQKIWLDDVRCLDDAPHWTGEPPTQLHHCYHAGWGNNNCTHEEDVHLSCTGVLNQTEATALTATLEDFPTNHDGSSPFTFRIAFSAEVEITPEAMRDHALVVSGATVTAAARVDGRSDLWELTVEPAGSGPVSILTPLERACTETGALCTAEGVMLTVAPALQVAGPVAQGQQALVPLAAGFVSVPAEHDGETEFWLELSFDAAVEQGSKQRIRALLGASGGSVTGLRRKDDRLDHWRIRVEPASHEAVTVTLSPSPPCGATGAVCTEDGRTFTTALATRIEGPPGLTVADAEVQEAANATLAFAVTLSRPPSSTVTVGYATSDGTATAGSDYTAASGTLTFAAGETEKTVSVPVLDDAHDEGSESLTLTLSNPSGAYLADGTATGTINNTDHMPRAWLARFGRTVADQVVDAVGERLRGPGGAGAEVRVAGQDLSGVPPDGEAVREAEAQARIESLTDWLRGETEEDRAALQTRTLTSRDFLTGTSFALTGGTEETGFGSVWGRGALTRFDGREDGRTLDGEVSSAMVGADWTLGRAMAGVAVAQSRGEGGYRASSRSEGNGSAAGSGEVETTLTGLYPYGRYAVDERLSVWGVLGYGEGELVLTPQGQSPMEAETDLAMAAAGVRGELLRAPENEGMALAMYSDALAVRTTSEAVAGPGGMEASEADVTRLRLGVEGSRPIRFEGEAALTPSLDIGVRHDGGDAERGFGVDIGGGLAWWDPASGLKLELHARGLLTHEAGGLRERGIGGALAWDPAPSSALGPSLTLRQTVGASATGGMAALLDPDTARRLAANDDGDELDRRRFEAVLGYGVPMFGGRFVGTPEIGLGLSDSEREIRLGWRLGLARREGNVSLELEAARRESANDDGEPEDRIAARLSLRW